MIRGVEGVGLGALKRVFESVYITPGVVVPQPGSLALKPTLCGERNMSLPASAGENMLQLHT